ncbi:MAG: glycoside hydrolase family 97 N-terminal domain-containing protein, partial [Bryobacteraceae bacterium]
MSARSNVVTASPDGGVRLIVRTGPEGRLTYTISLKGRSAIDPSRLGIVVDGTDLGDGVKLGKIDRYRIDETYPWYGVHAKATDRANGARISATHRRSGIAYTIDVRVFDDGAAFRYVVPGGGKKRVPGEATAFTIPAGSSVWIEGLRGHYEGQHKKMAVDDAIAGEWAAPPLTFRLPHGEGYGAITEANLAGYAGMALQGDGRRGFLARLGNDEPISYPFHLRYPQAEESVKIPAVFMGTITTPWRVLIAGPDLNALVNSDMVPDLCPPP